MPKLPKMERYDFNLKLVDILAKVIEELGLREKGQKKHEYADLLTEAKPLQDAAYDGRVR